MRAVLLEVSPEDLSRRRRIGLDRRDEVWEGVLHMAPAPANEHQRIVDELLVFLLPLLRSGGRGIVRAGINVFDEASQSENYRIPDLTFVAAGRERLFAADGIRGGAPDAVFEVRSPGDETYDKLPSFAALGVREVAVIERDSKRPEVFRLAGGQYLEVAPERDGWIACETLRVRLRTSGGAPGVLIVADARASGASVEI